MIHTRARSSLPCSQLTQLCTHGGTSRCWYAEACHTLASSDHSPSGPESAVYTHTHMQSQTATSPRQHATDIVYQQCSSGSHTLVPRVCALTGVRAMQAPPHTASMDIVCRKPFRISSSILWRPIMNLTTFNGIKPRQGIPREYQCLCKACMH